MPETGDPESGLPLAEGEGLPEVGEPELGPKTLGLPDGRLLGNTDDSAEGLPALEPCGLTTDEVADGCEVVELPDVAEGEVALPLEEPRPLETMLDEAAATELTF